MKQLSRRDFIRYSGGFLMFTTADVGSLNAARLPKLSFSTLGCPDWSLDQIINFASANHYSGIEIRGIQREIELTKSPHFSSESAISETKKKIAGKGLKVVGLGSSAALHHREGEERNKAMDEAKRYIQLASKLGCPYVRVFPNNLPAGVPKEETLGLISRGLTDLGKFSEGSGVKVLMETHGDIIWAADIESVMLQAGNQRQIGLVWDVANMWSVTGEKPSDVYVKLKKWIRHTHFKDLKKMNDKHEYRLFGEGEAPVFEAIDALHRDNYKGYFSFEWEKLWHPEIAEPEIAIAQYPVKMREYFGKLK